LYQILATIQVDENTPSIEDEFVFVDQDDVGRHRLAVDVKVMAVIERLGENLGADSFGMFHILVEFEFEQDIFVKCIGSSFFELNLVAIECLNDELADGRFGIGRSAVFRTTPSEGEITFSSSQGPLYYKWREVNMCPLCPSQ
jgi:hypothetical protein